MLIPLFYMRVYVIIFITVAAKRKRQCTCLAHFCSSELAKRSSYAACSMVSHSFTCHPHVLCPQEQSQTWNITSATNYLTLLLILPTSEDGSLSQAICLAVELNLLTRMNEHALESVRQPTELAGQTEIAHIYIQEDGQVDEVIP